MNPAGLATVTLSRTAEADVRQRQIYVRIEDGPTHTLLYGNVVTIDVPPGTHRLRANNTLFWKSVSFEVEPEQRVEFVLINRASRVGFGILAILGVSPLILSIERR